jgi:hypothetical protein
MNESIKRPLRNFINCVILDRHECVGYFKNKFAKTGKTFICNTDVVDAYYVCMHCGKDSRNKKQWGKFRTWLNRVACRTFNFHLLVKETSFHLISDKEDIIDVIPWYKCAICNHEEGHRHVHIR